ncbi:DUF5686 family protein [Geofilum sp. OHC36d9]|uniref:DUF5686 family protein n=1 Tax=Geofilum sp. OHC36d9 TaxID=3458413 RepID=UPI004033BBF6
MYNRFLLFFSSFLLTVQSFAQTTVATGVVFDAETHEALPYVSVTFNKTTVGVMTDTVGRFRIEIKQPIDSLKISTVGYEPKTLPLQNGVVNSFNIALKPIVFALNEIQVKPDEGPVRSLMRNFVTHKNRNNPDNIKNYAFRRYNRWNYQINNVGDQMQSWRLFDKAQDAFQYDENGRRFLPVYFSEQIVYNEIQNNPPRRKSTIEADITNGLGMLQDTEIAGFTSGLDNGINFYNNTIQILGHSFISPAADNGWFFYNYYLLDSVVTDAGKTFTVRFTPRRIGDNTFTGQMSVEDNYFSLVNVEAELTNNNHLNFIKGLKLSSDYRLVNDSIPFFSKSEVTSIIDYMPVELQKNNRRVELQAVNSMIFSDVEVDRKEEVVLSHPRLTYESVKERQYNKRDSTYWLSARPAGVHEDNVVFSASIKKVNNLPVIKILDNVAQMTISGYYDLGQWELGPYDYLFNLNEVEGKHLFIGGRTSSELSEYFSLWGGVGYGTRNEQWLGRLGGGYMLPTPRRNLIKLEYSDDIVLIGENEKILMLYENKQHTSESNLVSSIFKRDKLDELMHRRRILGTLEKEIRTGFTIKSTASYTTMYSPEFYPFTTSGVEVPSFDVSELNFNFRWSWKEKFLDYGYRRMYMSTPYPIINLSLAGGMANIDGEQPYGRIHASLKHFFYMGQMRMDYAFEGGWIVGSVPFPLLDIPRANETYGFQSYNFNMMNNLEFVHDRYLHTFVEYRLNGFVFKRLPLIKHLGLREVLSVKAMVGQVSDRHKELLDFPVSISPYNSDPYSEVGVGVENILRFFRIDAVWRLSQSEMGPRFGLRGRMEIRI